MSDNTSQPSVKSCADKINAKHIHGRPEPELVPSRYALKVGEIDVMVVSDGVLSLPGAMLGHNVDPAVRAAWLEDMFLPPDVLEWALNVVVVRSGGRTILIDAGMGTGGHSPIVPIRMPCGGRRRRLSLGTGPLGVLTACWVRAERDHRKRLNETDGRR